MKRESERGIEKESVKEREIERERECVCKRESVCVKGRKSVFVCLNEREKNLNEENILSKKLCFSNPEGKKIRFLNSVGVFSVRVRRIVLYRVNQDSFA